MNYSIYQMSHNESTRYNVFMPYKYNAPVIASLPYENVYNGSVSAKESVSETLDYLFHVFNMERPADFVGHSMSVSDIVVLDGIAYYVDSYGWEKVEGWSV